MPAHLPRLERRARRAFALIACLLLASATLPGCGSGAAKAQKRAYKVARHHAERTLETAQLPFLR